MTYSNSKTSLLRVSASLREQKKGFTRRRGGAEFALMLAAAFLPSVALAEDALECGDDCIIIADSKTSPIVVVAARAITNQSETGQAVTLITQADLKRVQTQSLADVLATTPGVSVSRNGGIGGFSAVRIRGAEGEQTLTLIDGVRMNDPSSPGGGFDFGTLLVGNLERVEVLRGPNSVPWGSQALGGVVSIVTKAPPPEFGGSVRAEYGYRNASNLTGQVGGTFGIFSANLGGGWFRDSGVSAFKNGTERDGFRQRAANGGVGIAISDSFKLDFRAYYAKSRTEADGYPPPFFGFADTPEFAETEQLFTYAGAKFTLFDETFKNRIAYSRAATDRDNYASPTATVPDFLARGRLERFEYQGEADFSSAIRAVFGAEHERSRFNDGFATARTSATSGYAQLIVSPTDTLTVTGGARIDDYKSYGSKGTVSANLAWRPSGSTIVRVAYGEGFKTPTLFQLLDGFYGNRTLNPETTKSYEIGIEQTLIDGRLTLGATLFQRNTVDQINFISCFGRTTGICAGRPFGTYDNVNRTRAKGLEAVLTARPTDGLIIEANYSLIDAEDRTTGLVLLRRPKHSINVSVDWEARKWLKLGASLRSVSDSADVDFQTFARTALDGYTLAGLRAAVPIGEAFEFYGRVENLFNVRYETVSGYGTYGRNAHVGVRAKF